MMLGGNIMNHPYEVGGILFTFAVLGGVLGGVAFDNYNVFPHGWKDVIEEAKSIVGTEPAYLSFDVDGLDPVFAPGTGTPEIGGFSNLEAQLMIRELGELNLVGGDLVEVAPPFDPTGNTALTGATLMFEILCVVAQSLSRR